MSKLDQEIKNVKEHIAGLKKGLAKKEKRLKELENSKKPFSWIWEKVDLDIDQRAIEREKEINRLVAELEKAKKEAEMCKDGRTQWRSRATKAEDELRYLQYKVSQHNCYQGFLEEQQLRFKAEDKLAKTRKELSDLQYAAESKRNAVNHHAAVAARAEKELADLRTQLADILDKHDPAK